MVHGSQQKSENEVPFPGSVQNSDQSFSSVLVSLEIFGNQLCNFDQELQECFQVKSTRDVGELIYKYCA